MRRARRHRRRDAAAGRIPAVHGPLHAQRALQGAAHPPRMGVRRARGDLRHGITRVRPRQGRGGRPRDGVQETESGGLLPEGRYRRDHDLAARRVSPGAPAADPHEQHDRTPQRGDPPAHQGRRQLPRRQERAHAHLRQDPIRHRQRLVEPPLPGHVPTR